MGAWLPWVRADLLWGAIAFCVHGFCHFLAWSGCGRTGKSRSAAYKNEGENRPAARRSIGGESPLFGAFGEGPAQAVGMVGTGLREIGGRVAADDLRLGAQANPAPATPNSPHGSRFGASASVSHGRGLAAARIPPRKRRSRRPNGRHSSRNRGLPRPPPRRASQAAPSYLRGPTIRRHQNLDCPDVHARPFA